MVRRPLSGSKDSIRRHKATKNKPAETHQEFYARLGGRIADHPEHYFMRWPHIVSARDIERFRQCCLDPILEQIWDWWEHVQKYPDPFMVWVDNANNRVESHGIHWIHPFGVYNVLNEGGQTELDHCVRTGSTEGLVRTKTLFPELE